MLDHTVGGVRQSARKVRPGKQGGVIENRVRQAVGGHLRQTAEDEREDGHCGEWLDDGPSHADRGLFIADLEVSPHEKIEQLSVSPELGPVEPGSWALRENQGAEMKRSLGWRSTLSRLYCLESSG